MRTTRPEGNEVLSVALLAPITADALRRAAAKEWKKLMPHAIDDPPGEVIAGHGEYSAIVWREPGSEASETNLAKRLSRATAEPVYALWLDPERLAIHVYERGERTGVREGLPRDLAEALGVPLPVPPTRTSERYSAARVEGASTSEVKAALGELGDEPWLHIEPIAGGAVVWSDDGDIGTAGWDAADALPEATVYLVLRGPEPDRFTVYQHHGGAEIGTFQLPPGEVPDVPGLDDVKGARTPHTIADALQIPRDRLGL